MERERGTPSSDGDGHGLKEWLEEDEPLRIAVESQPQLLTLLDRCQSALELDGVEFPIAEDMVGHYSMPVVETVDDCAEVLRSICRRDDRVYAIIKMLEACLTLCVLYSVDVGDIMEEVAA